MSILTVKDLSHRYDQRKTDGIKDISFQVEKGEIISLIGPSGSGKTTTLKCISGEIKTDAVTFSEEVSISVIDQNPSLEQNKSVFENLETRIMHISDANKRENQVRTTLALLEITNEINSPIDHLSGGQKQRLILGMALVTNPTLLLLDEPFANLDKNLRELLLNELWDVFREKEISVIWVTHNTEEALKYSDRLVLLNFGEIQQIGNPRDLFFKPSNIFTAQFFGENNILPAKRIDDNTYSLLGKEITTSSKVPKEDDFLIIIRPQFFYLDKDSDIKAKVENIFFLGSLQLVQTSYKALRIYIEVSSEINIKKDEKLSMNFNDDHLSILNQL